MSFISSYLSITDSGATPTNLWYAEYSVDGGNNTGWNINTSNIIFCNFLNIRDSLASPTLTWYANTSTDSGNNLNWIFVNYYEVNAADTATFTDTQDVIFGQFGSVSESTTLTDTQSTVVSFVPQIAELLTLTDSESAIAVYVPTVTETITLVDAQIQRGWIKIDNSQNPNWVDINNYQG
jgi:hypothetical protein